MNTEHLTDNPPIVTQRRFKVVAEVEVTVYEMPHTPQETELFGRVRYGGEGIQEFLDAENALMSEMLKSPDDLRAYLSYRAACATDLEHHVFEDWKNSDTFLETMIERLPPEQQDFLSRSCNDAFYHALDAQIKSVAVEKNLD